MAKPKLKAVLWILAAAAGGVLIAALITGLTFAWFIHKVEAWFIDSSAPVRVELLDGIDNEDLASGRYALILDDFVTGAGPRLISDPGELARLAPELWYLRESNLGTGIASAIGLSVGASPYREIGSLLQDGTTLRSFNCLSVVCRIWPEGGPGNPAPDTPPWGMGGLRARALPGQPVELVSAHFENYEAYLIAHKSIAADPTRWFATVGGDIPAPPDTGMRTIHVDLPSELVTLQDPVTFPPVMVPEAGAPDPVAVLGGHARAWIGEGVGEGGGNVVAVRISEPMPFWVEKDGVTVHDDQGNRALPGLGWRDRSITIEVPEARLDEVTSRIDTGFAASPDRLRLNDAAHSAFVAWGMDASCLPGCGGADMSRIITASSFMVAPKPSWSIESWRLLPGEEPG